MYGIIVNVAIGRPNEIVNRTAMEIALEKVSGVNAPSTEVQEAKGILSERARPSYMRAAVFLWSLRAPSPSQNSSLPMCVYVPRRFRSIA